MKNRNPVMLGIGMVLFILSAIPLVYTCIMAVHNMIFGFFSDFRGTESYGLEALIRTFLLYAWVYWPIVILQIVLLTAAVIFFLRWLHRK